MDDQNKNLILATALSFLVIMVWFILFPPEEQVIDPNATAVTQSTVEGGAVPAADGPVQSGTPAIASTTGETRAATLSQSVRIPVETENFEGSISLTGGRLDDLKLSRYKESLDADSDQVTLLSPVGTPGAYLAVFGWAPGGSLGFEDVPGSNTPWTVEGTPTLTETSPVTLTWDNGAGLTFSREISVDDKFMFTVRQSVTNASGEIQRLAPFSSIERYGEPTDQKGFFIIHEGAMRQTGEELEELDYGDLRDFEADPRWGPNSSVAEIEANGWLGFTDHYWMTTLVPAGDLPFTSVLQYDAGADIYRSTARLATVELADGATTEVTTQFFAGAKEWEAIREYESANTIYRFIDSIDWGWFFFLTKPIFAVLHWLNGIIGNMGWAIITLTLLIKAILFPLAYKSYVSMAKMKELQPEMEKIKERTGDDRQKLQVEMMALYKKEKVNPAAGCLPILLQIPIFFSLYKVIFVTIELRHAPWFGPFQDLSAPDPTSILNLWGLLPFAAPEPGSIVALIFIGILPLILGISMWLQQKLNPAPTDPTQQMIFAWMPWVFMFMLGSFASGLVVYWIANNIITFIQQYAIMRSQGYTPDIFGNIRAGFQRDKAEK